jgi:hypothetical protein
MSLRSWFYLIARTMGDINAILRGRFLRRLVRKTALRETAKLINRSIR